ELLAILKSLFDDDDESSDDEEEDPLDHGSRLEDEDYFAKTFGFSIGYRTPDMLDVQLYDKKGRRGKVIWMEIGRRWDKTIGGAEVSIFLKNIGLQLIDWEHVSLSELTTRLKTPRKEGEAKGPKIGLRVSGGIRIGPAQLALIGAGFTVTLDNPAAFEFKLD